MTLRALQERHAAIEAALLAGGPNPLPGELDDDEWRYQLAAFQFDGPLHCDILLNAEDAIEALVEFMPEFWAEGEEGE